MFMEPLAGTIILNEPLLRRGPTVLSSDRVEQNEYGCYLESLSTTYCFWKACSFHYHEVRLKV